MAEWRRRALIGAIVALLAAVLLVALLRCCPRVRRTTTAALVARAPPTEGLPAAYTPSSLSAYAGDSPVLLLAIDGRVYEVSAARSRYGPGGSYAAMAGRDATHHLARYTLPAPDEPRHDCPLGRAGLTDRQAGALDGWTDFFAAKYPVVGRLVCEDGTEAVHDS